VLLLHGTLKNLQADCPVPLLAQAFRAGRWDYCVACWMRRRLNDGSCAARGLPRFCRNEERKTGVYAVSQYLKCTSRASLIELHFPAWPTEYCLTGRSTANMSYSLQQCHVLCTDLALALTPLLAEGQDSCLACETLAGRGERFAWQTSLTQISSAQMSSDEAARQNRAVVKVLSVRSPSQIQSAQAGVLVSLPTISNSLLAYT